MFKIATKRMSASALKAVTQEEKCGVVGDMVLPGTYIKILSRKLYIDNSIAG